MDYPYGSLKLVVIYPILFCHTPITLPMTRPERLVARHIGDARDRPKKYLHETWIFFDPNFQCTSDCSIFEIYVIMVENHTDVANIGVDHSIFVWRSYLERGKSTIFRDHYGPLNSSFAGLSYMRCLNNS